MSSRIVIPQGNYTVGIAVTVTPVVAFDMTTVTGVVFKVLRTLDGSTATWTATISGATTGQLVASYTTAPGDLTVTGTYVLSPDATAPGALFPCGDVELFVPTRAQFRG